MRHVLIALLVAAFVLPACANSPRERANEQEEAAELRQTVEEFHRQMRWQRWEAAAGMVAPERRQAFLGRYEELGDDYRISNLELKSVERDEKGRAVVDLEEESYTEPKMTVEDERIVEMWERRDEGWLLTDRMPRDEYRARHKGDDEDEKAPQEGKNPGESEGSGGQAPQSPPVR